MGTQVRCCKIAAPMRGTPSCYLFRSASMSILRDNWGDTPAWFLCCPRHQTSALVCCGLDVAGSVALAYSMLNMLEVGSTARRAGIGSDLRAATIVTFLIKYILFPFSWLTPHFKPLLCCPFILAPHLALVVCHPLQAAPCLCPHLVQHSECWPLQCRLLWRPHSRGRQGVAEGRGPARDWRF